MSRVHARPSDRLEPSLWLRLLRRLPPGAPGKWRLARCCLRGRLGVDELRVMDAFGCQYLVPNGRETLGFALLVDGVYEPALMRLILGRLTPDAVFIDVGANIGTFTLPIAKALGPKGTVLAVEPSPSVLPYLTTNLAMNRARNVVLERCAALDLDDTQVAFYPAPMERFGMGALAPQFGASPIPVRAATLDRLVKTHRLDRVDMIKLDVEGYEAAVLRGSAEILSAARAPWIFFEFLDWAEARATGGRVGDAQAVLQRFGYQIWRLSAVLRQRRPLREVLTTGSDTLVAIKA